MNKDRRLGRGLAALLGTPPDSAAEPGAPAAEAVDQALQSGTDAPSATDSSSPSDSLLQLNVYQIDDNPFQPRRDFGDSEIRALAESLKAHEMLQPILVRREGDRYQLISGERRLRAAIHAGWSTVPARIREADDRLVAELAIVENLQRKDLNAIEKALSFKRYLDEHGCTQDELAGRLSIDRSTVANLLRLLELPEAVIERVRRGELTAGHARALLPLGEEPAQCSVAAMIVEQGWSVRAAEQAVREQIAREDGEPDRDGGSDGRGPKAAPVVSDQIESLMQQLRTALGTRVDIKTTGKQRGTITIHFANHAEFERLHGLLSGQAPDAQRQAG